MADEPPPLDFNESQPAEEPKNDSEDGDDDLFGTSNIENRGVGEKEESKGEAGEPAQLVVEPTAAEDEPPTLDTSEPPTTNGGDLFDDEPVKPPTEPPVKEKLVEHQPSSTGPSLEEPHPQEAEEEEEEDNEVDEYELTIAVSSPEKVGDGMGAYVTYMITTKTTLPLFKSPEFFVRRRFSDFLGLYYRLAEKLMQLGHIVPPAPEKSVTGMTKIKFSKTEDAAFLERRRANLERFLNRLARHPIIRKDEILRSFLENPAELPKAKETSAMSGAGFMRLVKNVGDSFTKMAGRKGDVDTWFEDRLQEYEVLDHHLKKLHAAIENMISSRKDLCTATGMFVKSVSTLANVEENNSVSRALTRLSEVEEKVESLHQEQSNKDLYLFGETIKDYIALINSLRETFISRIKVYNSWQNASKTLQSKRDSEAKMQSTGKTEKLPIVQQEIKDWEEKEKQGQKNFEKCSKVLKKEVERFEVNRAKEFKEKFLSHLESLMHMQEELMRLWEGYLGDAKAIETE